MDPDSDSEDELSSLLEGPWVSTTPRPSPRDASEGLRSVGTALDVLECFATDGDLGVSDIARRLGIGKSTAHRLLHTLASRGLVEQDRDSGRYRLGLHLFELGRLAQARHTLLHSALPVMEHLYALTHLTVNLSVFDGPDVVFVERLQQHNVDEHLMHSGMRLPAHCTSSGKAMAAFNPTYDRARREAGFPPRSSKTVRSEHDWDRELSLVRRQGFAVSESESFNGVSSIAVPILDLRRRAVASLSLFGRTEDLQSRIPQLAELLRVEARRIGRGVAR